MSDLISRQAAIDAIYHSGVKLTVKPKEDVDGWLKENQRVINNLARAQEMAINQLPSVEPERKLGKWEYVVSTADVYGKWVCSECNKLIIGSSTQKPQHNYCPDCGADMREVDNGRTD